MPTSDHTLPLSRYTVLDLTRARSGPTAVRQLADWGANVIKIEPSGRPGRLQQPVRQAPRPGFSEPASQQAQHHARSQGARRSGRVQAPRRQGRRHRRELPAGRKVPARHRLRNTAQDQPPPGLCQHFRLRPGRSVQGPAGTGPGGAGHGRADVGHRAAGAGSGARRHRDLGQHRRPLLRVRYRARAARARTHGRRAVGGNFTAAGTDRAHGFPGRALAGQPRSAGTGGQQPPDGDSDRRVQNRGRPHQHRRLGPACSTGCAMPSAPRS